MGNGWDQGEMGRLPNCDDLNEAMPDGDTRVVLLNRICYHIAVTNSAGLQLGSISAATNDPDGGQIDRKEDSQEPSGIVRETACEALYKLLDDTTNEETRQRYLLRAFEKCLENGITAVQTNDRYYWKTYQALSRQRKIPIRVFLTIDYKELDDPSHQHLPGPYEISSDVLGYALCSLS